MILAVDPGRDKCGLAVLDRSKRVFLQEIILRGELEAYLQEIANRFKIEVGVIGNGTYSQETGEIIQKQLKVPLIYVEERGTTLAAEERYRQHNYHPFFKKILSFLQWKPSKPVDDYVAVILAERYLDNISRK